MSASNVCVQATMQFGLAIKFYILFLIFLGINTVVAKIHCVIGFTGSRQRSDAKRFQIVLRETEEEFN